MSTSRTGRATTAVLVSILFLAALLRLLGLDHGLPHIVGVDEGFEVHRALRLGAGEFDFDRDGKGGFFYLLFVEYGVYFVWLLLTGQIGSPTDFARAFVTDLTPFWMIGRVTHALVSLGVVLWTYRLGRRMYGSRVGLFGAAAVAVSTLHVSRGQFIGVDVPMVLLVLGVLELTISWSSSDRPRRPMLLGTVLGFAMMTKIVAVAAVVPVMLAQWLRGRGRPLLQRLVERKIVLAFAVAAMVFMVGNPGFVLNMKNFFGDALSALFGVGAESNSPASEGNAPNLWLFYLRILSKDLGFPLLALGLAGVVFAAVRRRRADLLLLATLAVFYLLIAGAQTTHLFYPRYVLPMIPMFALLGGRLLDRLARRLPVKPAMASAALAVATAALLLPTTAESWAFTAGRLRPDTRELALDWFAANARPNSAVFLIGNPLIDTAPNLSLPLRNSDRNLDVLIEEVRAIEPSKAQVLEWRKARGTTPSFDLRAVRHFEANAALDRYLAADVQYFILDSNHFGAERLARDRKHADDVLASRAALAEACAADPRLRLAFSVDPVEQGLTGPRIEVYEAREAPGSGASGANE